MMIVALQNNTNLKTALVVYAATTMSYGFYRGYSFQNRAMKKGNELPEPTSLTQNFVNALTLGVSSLILVPFNIVRILTRPNGDNDIL
jgi:hypothetical protein